MLEIIIKLPIGFSSSNDFSGIPTYGITSEFFWEPRVFVPNRFMAHEVLQVIFNEYYSFFVDSVGI